MANHQIIFLSGQGFPYGRAGVQRLRLIAKSLVDAGASVTVLIKTGNYRPGEEAPANPIGEADGINYIYCSGKILRGTNPLSRTLNKLYGALKEFKHVQAINRRQRIRGAVISTLSIVECLRCWIVSRLFGFSIVMNYVELKSALAGTGAFGEVWGENSDGLATKLMDGILPISRILHQKVAGKNPQKPVLRMPVLVDMARFEAPVPKPERDYILYCGALNYLEVVIFILDAYKAILDDTIPPLYLVIHGTPTQLARLRLEIDKREFGTSVQVFRDLSDDALARMYQQARCLLIPMRPTRQDQARFPHKIGEYLASGVPLITTPVGEVNAFLRHEENAFIAAAYDVAAYGRMIRHALAAGDKAKAVGLAGRETARQHFDYRLYGPKLLEFIVGLNESVESVRKGTNR